MKDDRRQKNDETGAFSLIEAVIIYPIVFLVMFFTIYVGLYILQLSTLSAYAQKIAVLTSREVSAPGYRKLLTGDRYATSAVEADFGKSDDSTAPAFTGKINISNKTKESSLRAYRYWSNPLVDNEKNYYTDALRRLVLNNSILNGPDANSVTVSIGCDNYFVTQFINVTVTQELLDFPILTFFGIDNPKPSATAVAPVSDTDELVRNTDFIVDAIEMFARKLGIDVSKVKSTVKSCLKKLGLLN